MTQAARTFAWASVALSLATAAACKGDTPTEPSGASCATITIANNTVSPKDVVVAPGCQVTFVNNDTRAHNMFSDPHPAHTDCPAINSVGLLNAGGASRQTGNLNTARVCGFHDHDLPQVAGLIGTITIR